MAWQALAAAGIQALGSMGGKGGTPKSYQAESGSTSNNVFGDVAFGSSGINKPMFDLNNPVHIGVLLVGVGLAVYIYKKVK